MEYGNSNQTPFNIQELVDTNKKFIVQQKNQKTNENLKKNEQLNLLQKFQILKNLHNCCNQINKEKNKNICFFLTNIFFQLFGNNIKLEFKNTSGSYSSIFLLTNIKENKEIIVRISQHETEDTSDINLIHNVINLNKKVLYDSYFFYDGKKIYYNLNSFNFDKTINYKNYIEEELKNHNIWNKFSIFLWKKE